MDSGVLSKRWEPLKYHETQQKALCSFFKYAFNEEIFKSLSPRFGWDNEWVSTVKKSRYIVLPCGRRSGKSELAKRILVMAAMIGTKYEKAYFFIAAPTRDQARRIFWQDLKDMVPKNFQSKRPSETQLIIYLPRSEIHVIGMDKPERIEGTPWDGGVLDEYGNMKSAAWSGNIMPALATREGWCWFTGTPEGRNHYYELTELARRTKNWAVYHWISADILPPEEIQAARETLDEKTFKQEFEGSFENESTQAYYCFSYESHSMDVNYNPELDLILCFDFNVSPGVAAICQEMVLPNGETGTAVVDEVYIKRNSNTLIVCNEILDRYASHRKNVTAYGDASGGNKGSAKLNGSDWDLITNSLKPIFGNRLTIDVPRANPSVRNRVNATNSRLKSTTGTIRVGINKDKCKNTLDDFNKVCILPGSNGDLDKSNVDTTHLTDAIGYYFSRKFPIANVKNVFEPFDFNGVF